MTGVSNERKIVIVGGGFAGVRTALSLSRRHLSGAKIILLTDKPHFEYTPALYRVCGGHSPLEVCVPLREIFAGTAVEVLTETVTAVDLAARILRGLSGAAYAYDFLVLALGSETAYGQLEEVPKQGRILKQVQDDEVGGQTRVLGFKTIAEALQLKHRLHEIFTTAGQETADHKVNLTIVGGGTGGVELAGELAVYTRALAGHHGLDPSRVVITLVEAAPCLLPGLPEPLARWAQGRLARLGVHLQLGRKGEDLEEGQTVLTVWCAGVRPHHLYAQINGLSLDAHGRVLVDDYLRVPSFPAVFVLGDAAARTGAGTAQTALRQAELTAANLGRTLGGQLLAREIPTAPAWAVPIGPGWALVAWRGRLFTGRRGWWLRRLADLRFFFSILPWRKALTAWRSDAILSEECPLCRPKGGE